MQEGYHSRARKMLNDAALDANIGVDTAESEFRKDPQMCRLARRHVKKACGHSVEFSLM